MRADVAEASLALAMEGGYPVISPAGRFVPDARVAWFIDAYETWHESLQERRYDPGWFHASSLGKSDAELIAAYRGETDESVHDARLLRVFDLGHNRDAAWKGYLRDAGLSAVADNHDRTMKLPYLRLVGECDDVLRGSDGFWIFEAKTMNPYKFSTLTEPVSEHVLQVHSYMGGMGIRDSLIVYENKGDQYLKVFAVPFDEAVWDGIVARLLRLREEAERG